MVHRISRAECDISKFSFFQPLLPLSFGLSFCGIWPIKKKWPLYQGRGVKNKSTVSFFFFWESIV